MSPQDPAHRNSLDSYIAESAISISLFPTPPSTTANTPTSRVFPSNSVHGQRAAIAPLVPNRKAPQPGPSNLSTASVRSQPLPQPPSPQSRTLSPYDWHEGASSIDVDATEDRLLSTSFITSLLRETGDTRRNSFASEALSEMTYPPVSQIEPRPVHSNLHVPRSARPPPSSFAAIPESGQLEASDSDTLYSSHDNYMPTIIRSASRARLEGANVVGVAPARLRSVAATSREITPSEVAPLQPNRMVSDSEDGRLAVGEYDLHPSSIPFSPALPSTAGSQLHFLRDSPSYSHTETRQSIHSVKSFVPSFISKVTSTSRSLSRVFARHKVKPLPPVPVIPHIPVADEIQHRRAEESLPLPFLMERAGTLNGMLEKGYHPHRSLNSYYQTLNLPKDEGVTSAVEDFDSRDDEYWRRRPTPSSPLTWVTPDSPKVRDLYAPRLVFTSQTPKKKRTIVIVLSIFIVVALAAVGAAVGVTVNRKAQALPKCSGDFTGAACNMNATCVCTSSVSRRCDGLAQNLVDLVPTMNTLFNSNYSNNAVYIAVWSAQGSVTESTCAPQSLLVDVAPGLVSGNFPNRTAWAQSALLWNLVQSQDTVAAASLQNFVVEAPWSKLANSDGPVDDPLSTYSTSASGFIFDFASQTVTQQSVSFVSNGQPTSTQNSRVGAIAHNTLDRMYSYALASSTQRQGALSSYWTSVLQQKPQDLTVFLSAFAASPILIPFDATSQVSTLYSSSSPFPPPIACYPGLNPSEIQQINTIESAVFGLSPLSPASIFDTSCYPDRPIYGVLDVLRLRLPFIDSRTGVAQQGVVLIRDVGSRAVVHSGEILSALPAKGGLASVSTVDADPRQYGTLNHLYHVVLNYLQAMDVTVATAVASYILGSNVVPPTNTTIPLQSLPDIPALEVAIFGSVLPADISSTVSSYTTPSGTLFFGSSQGEALRVWSLSNVSHPVQWADSAVAPLIADDSSLTDTIFNETWSVAAQAIAHNVQVSVTNITNSLKSNGKLTPT